MSKPMRVGALELLFERIGDALIKLEGEQGTSSKERRAYDERVEVLSCVQGLLWEMEQVARGLNVVQDPKFSELDVAVLRELAAVEVDCPLIGEPHT